MMTFVITMLLSMNVNSAQRVQEVTRTDDPAPFAYSVHTPNIRKRSTPQIAANEGNNGIMPDVVAKHW